VKTFLALIAMSLVTTTFAGAAQAKPVIVNKDKVARAAALERIQLDENLAPIGKAVGGSIELDVPNKTATLRIELAVECKAGEMCPHIVPAPIEVTLPIVSVKVDGCGTKMIIAKQDERPLDGALHLLTIEDNTTNICPHFVMMSPTVVVYQTEIFDRRSGKAVKTMTTAYGPEMSPLAL
jgi:hypothetical protein